MTGSERLRSPEELQTDICVIGAGPAGISFAHEYVGRSTGVVVVESGSYEYDTRAQELSRGEANSKHYAGDALSVGRRRQFGGTSNLWVYRTLPGSGRRYARSLPPQAIDFEARDNDTTGGWPFPVTAIEPHYERAQALWNGGPFDYDVRSWADAGSLPIQFNDDVLTTQMCQHGPADVYALRYRDDLLAAENVTIQLGCTVLQLEWDTRRAAVRRAWIAREDGSTYSITAKAFVLAAGGVENVQLLLLSDASRPGGPANLHDNVGRYVTDHPEFRMGTIKLADRTVPERLGLYDMRWVGPSLVSAYLTITEDIKRNEGLLNLSGVLVPQPAQFGSPAHRSISSLLALRRGEVDTGLLSHVRSIVGSPREAASVLGLRGERYKEFSGGWSRPEVHSQAFGAIEVHAATEQTSDRHNQITLGAARDRLGRRQPVLHWRWSDSDQDNVGRSIAIFAAQMQDAGLGHFTQWVDFDGARRPYSAGLHHPMGGTRIHPDAHYGVVDENLLVHGTGNLYVAGSSVFPSGHGYANPTLSIIALAIRLADHLKIVVG